MARNERRLANDAWESLMTAHATLIKSMATSPVWDALSMREYDVIYTLSKCAEPVRQSELGRHVLLSQPALSRLIVRLVDRGLIARATDPGDARGVLLSLTDEGRALQRRIGVRHAADVARAVAARLTRAEMEDLERLTRKLHGRPITRSAPL